jgi:Flp pilus assembly protein CpaB
MLRPLLFLAAFVVFFASQSPLPPAKGDDPKSTLVAVLVAKRDINSFESLDEPEKLFKVVHYLKGDEPRDAITDWDQVKGKSLARYVTEDEPLKKRHIGSPIQSGSWLVNPRHRVMFLRLPKEAIGSADVHDRVDLYGVPKQDSKKSPELLVKNLLIMAVVEDRDDLEGGVAFNVTMESAQVINTCRKTMDFSLKVRSVESPEVVKKLEK